MTIPSTPPREVGVISTLIWPAVAVLTAAAAVVLALQLRRTHRALAAAEATQRLTDAAWHRDMTAHTRRTAATRAVLTDADTILDRALAAHTHHPHDQEGGTP